ncbi:MAG: type II toxin-antitoxin system HicB family antitoxin [Candidatus Magasanikbacteria bacterium]
MKNKTLHYNIVLRPEPEGGFTVTVPALPGCITYGSSLEEAKDMASDAIQAYLASVSKHKGDVVSDNNSFITTLDIAYA